MRSVGAADSASASSGAGAVAPPRPPHEEVDSTMGDGSSVASSQRSSKRRGRKGRGSGARDGGESFPRRRYFATQLATPEWMVEVPSDLNGVGSQSHAGWFVLPRPEGQRCLVIASGAATTARTKDGSILEVFPSALPNGSPTTGAGRDNFSILDCIFHRESGTFFVFDMMCWRGRALFDSPAEVRLFWVHSRLAEVPGVTVPSPESGNTYAFIPALTYECDLEGLEAAYRGAEATFRRDGLVFVNKAGHYHLGVTPLMLQWRDEVTSAWYERLNATVVELPDGSAETESTAVLCLHPDYSLRTQDDVSLGALTEDVVVSSRYRKFELLKCQIRGAQIGSLPAENPGDAPVAVVLEETLVPMVSDLAVVGKAGKRRVQADSWSRLLSQHNAARGQRVTIEQLADAASTRAPELPLGLGGGEDAYVEHDAEVGAGDTTAAGPTGTPAGGDCVPDAGHSAAFLPAWEAVPTHAGTAGAGAAGGDDEMGE